ncbi:MAG: ABC transporter permease [Gemmatimonadota bacterium]
MRRWVASSVMARIGWAGVGLFVTAAILAPFLTPYDPVVQGELVGGRLLPPSTLHPLGTDPFARDVLSRLLHGARVSLGVAGLAVAISMTLGVLVGGIAGYVGGKLDGALMWLVDLVLAFPRLVLLIVLVAVLEPSTGLLILALGLTQWPPVARLVRGEVLSLREREFVQAARVAGLPHHRILFRHVLPSTAAPVVAAAALGMGDTIVLEAGLSFLGLGVQPPAPSWGAMVAEGRNHLPGAWWLATFPGMAIVLAVVAFNLAGEGVRSALDPREQGQ